MNIADVTIAGAGIGLSVRFRAIAVGIADEQQHTVGSDATPVQSDGVGGA